MTLKVFLIGPTAFKTGFQAFKFVCLVLKELSPLGQFCVVHWGEVTANIPYLRKLCVYQDCNGSSQKL